MIRRLFTALSAGILLLVLLQTFAATNAIALESGVSEQYRNAKYYLKQLQSETPDSTTRRQWLRGAYNFRLIYLSHPRSELAPNCLFMMGRTFTEIYDLYHKKSDLQDAVTYYNHLLRFFPASNLADDSALHLAELYLHHFHNPEKAGEYLTRIVEHYPQGDMRRRAEERLKQLSQDYNIPLPQVMISPQQDSSQLNSMRPVKYWSSPSYTRVIINGTNPVKYTAKMLPATKNQPARLVIDFEKSYIAPRFRQPVPIKNGLLRQVRTGQFTPDTVRVVLDIDSIDDYDIFSLPEPSYRVVVDVHGKAGNLPRPEPDAALRRPTGEEMVSATVPVLRARHKVRFEVKKSRNRKGEKITRQIPVLRDHKKRLYTAASAPRRNKTPSYSLAQQFGLGVKKIIIDPGHGGKDPGASGFGLKEKDIVLKLAKKLEPILKEKLKCEVVLTRRDDTFIPLEERTAVANTNGRTDADLFVSLHINAHESAKVHGLETYYLNLTRDPEAMRVAAAENATTTHQMSDLQELLSNMMKNSKISESERLAKAVQKSIVRAGKRSDPDVKNLGVKKAPFVVLIGAKMPAILVEAGFITNAADAANLRNPAWLESLAEGIADGIATYMKSIKVAPK